jgi:hypothetical protein
MPSDRAFRIPRAHKDRVHARQLVAIAATCMSVGVALSGVLAAKHRERGSVEHAQAWRSASVGPALPSLEDAQLVIEAALDPLTHSEARTETSISAATTAPASAIADAAVTSKKPGKAAKTALVRGAVTYHCDAADRSLGACQPDRVLEARVWRALARLSSCRGTVDTLGYADLKLWLGPSATTQVVFAASTISPSLNLRAVSQCVARDLSKLRATRKADRFELSLSFGLAARN